MSKKTIAAGLVVVAAVAALAYGMLESDPEDASPGAAGSPVMGSPEAEVTITEFGDYQCHQCYNWFHNTKPELTAEYIDTGMVNLVFIDMAFLGRHSPTAAQAAHCAGDQNAYWEYHDTLYQHQEPKIDGGWADAGRLKAFAFTMGLDSIMFDECLDSGKYKKRVQENTSHGRSLGVSGTPTFFITTEDGRSEKLVGAQPYTVFKRVLDQLI